MKELLDDISHKLKLIAKEMGQLPNSTRRDKLIRELKNLAENIHNYRVENLKQQGQ